MRDVLAKELEMLERRAACWDDLREWLVLTDLHRGWKQYDDPGDAVLAKMAELEREEGGR